MEVNLKDFTVRKLSEEKVEQEGNYRHKETVSFI